jgi:hypothetical protein
MTDEERISYQTDEKRGNEEKKKARNKNSREDPGHCRPA